MASHLLFDFFGTLVQYSTQPIGDGYAATYDYVKEAGYTGGYDRFAQIWSETYDALDEGARVTHLEFSMDHLVDEVLKRTIGKMESSFRAQLIETYIREWNSSVHYIDGLPNMLTRLQEFFVVGIISNTHYEKLIPEHLSAMGITDQVTTLVTSVGFGVRKPNREIFEHTLRLLDVEPKDCFYIGDSYEADYCGAMSADICAFLIDPHGASQVPEKYRLKTVMDIESRALRAQHSAPPGMLRR